jgi:hypothetical protein
VPFNLLGRKILQAERSLKRSADGVQRRSEDTLTCHRLNDTPLYLKFEKNRSTIFVI